MWVDVWKFILYDVVFGIGVLVYECLVECVVVI